MKNNNRVESIGPDDEGGIIIIHHKRNKKHCFHLFTGLIAIGLLVLCGCSSNKAGEMTYTEAPEPVAEVATEYSKEDDMQEDPDPSETTDEKESESNYLEDESVIKREESLLEIKYEVPETWISEEYADDLVSGRRYSLSEESPRDLYTDIYYVELDRVDKGIDNIRDLITYLTDSVRLSGDIDSYAEDIFDDGSVLYTCHFSNSEMYQSEYLSPAYEKGLLAVTYTYDSGQKNQYWDDYQNMIDSISIPEESVLHEAYNEACGSAEEIRVVQNMSTGETEICYNEADVDNISFDDSVHNYYKGIPREGAEAADAVARDIANSIMNNPEYQTDLEKVNAAARIVAGYCEQIPFGMDEYKYYRSPYGVFVAGAYTCAGSTRALGRVLDFMGFSWNHTHENENRHQWCVLTMDGQKGFADGMAGVAGYGEMVNGMTMPDGRVISFYE